MSVEIQRCDASRLQVIDQRSSPAPSSPAPYFPPTNIHGMNAVNRPYLLMRRKAFQWFTDGATPRAAKHIVHGRPAVPANAPRDALLPIIRWCISARRFCARMFVVQNFPSRLLWAGLQPRVHRAAESFPARLIFGNLRRWHKISARRSSEMHLRVARFQRAQQIFRSSRLQVRMQPALQQNPRGRQLRSLQFSRRCFSNDRMYPSRAPAAGKTRERAVTPCRSSCN